MKRLLTAITALLLVASSFGAAHKALAAPGPNLVVNPSAETVTGPDAPASWGRGGWGTNTSTLSHRTDSAHTGTSSLQVTVTSYTSGDAKWYFAPVSIAAGQNYTYSDWYKSSISTDIVAQYETAAGVYSYAWLGTTAASATNWTQFSTSFTAPANAAKVSIFHLIAGAGSLQTDDTHLGLTSVADPDPDPVPTPGNTVPNGSVETINGSQPASWAPSSWGTNNAAFSYPTNGQDGSRSVRIDMTSRTSGDAKWTYGQQPVTAGATYNFSNYYQSSVATEVDVNVIMSNGSSQWYWLASAPASATWRQFTGSFTMPAGAVSASVMHILGAPGWLQTDNYVFSTNAVPNPTPGARPLVSLTFDDSWRSIYTNGFSRLQQHGFKSTQYFLTGVSNDPEYMTLAMMRAFKDAGHEVASHTIDHPDLTSLSANELDRQLRESKLWLQTNLGVTPTNFAPPYGSFGTREENAIKQYYTSNRGVEDGYNNPSNFDRYNIMVQNMTNTTSITQFQSWLNHAKQNNEWLVLVYHEIGTNIGGDIYYVPTSNFDAQLNAIQQSGIAVVTVQQALDELQ